MKATNKSKITDIISKSSPTVSVSSEFLLFCLPTPYWGGGRKGAFSYLLHYPLEQTSSRDFVWTWSDTPQIGKQEILQCRRWSLPKVPFFLGQLDPCLIQRRLKQLRKRKQLQRITLLLKQANFIFCCTCDCFVFKFLHSENHRTDPLPTNLPPRISAKVPTILWAQLKILRLQHNGKQKQKLKLLSNSTAAGARNFLSLFLGTIFFNKRRPLSSLHFRSVCEEELDNLQD